MRLLRYIVTLFKIINGINIQRKRNQLFLLPYIKSLEKKHNGIFPEQQAKKIINYYGLFIPSILCTSYKRLNAKKLTNDERKRVSLLGILTPVGDDLFDIDKLDAESIRTITFAPETYGAHTFSSSVAKEIQSYLLQNVPNKKEYTEASGNVFEIQLETIRQTDPSISNHEIEKITYAKGGYSVILYYQTLDEAASAEMLKVLFHIGSLMQLANDCLDIYKDINDGIYTLANRCNDYRELKRIFLQRVKETNRLISALPHNKLRKQEFSVVMYFIIARGLVAIEQMIKLQRKLKAPVDCLKAERSQLITDMEKPKNIIKWLCYTYKLSRLK
ncbi:MAG: hypothetical protein ABIN97_18605 [Ginsengibacter sp.]